MFYQREGKASVFMRTRNPQNRAKEHSAHINTAVNRAPGHRKHQQSEAQIQVQVHSSRLPEDVLWGLRRWSETSGRAEQAHSCPRNTDHRDTVAQFRLIWKTPHKDNVEKFVIFSLTCLQITHRLTVKESFQASSGVSPILSVGLTFQVLTCDWGVGQPPPAGWSSGDTEHPRGLAPLQPTLHQFWTPETGRGKTAHFQILNS